MAKFILLLGVLAGLVSATAAAAPGSSDEGPAAAVAPRTRVVVVLDPGHGGSNPGATGSVDGVHEKQITMALSTQVAALLVAQGVEVHLTRDADRTLTLRQRSVEANQLAADLFVSIHANASPTRTQRGFETFVLTTDGVDIDGRALRSDSGTPRLGVDGATALILDDVERGAAQWEAAELAATMQDQLEAVRGKTGDRGVRQDAQHVLLGATMPAVLVEVGFIDHPIEGRELVDPAVQRDLAGAIAASILAQLAE